MDEASSVSTLAPEFRLPPGAVDTHCHVLGPEAVFPYAAAVRYRPHDAPKAALFALRDRLGLARNVIVQPTAHGLDHSALVDALAAAGNRARGVALADPVAGVADLDRLHAAGVRAVRFHFLSRLAPQWPADTYLRIADQVARRGWHVDAYMACGDLGRLAPLLGRMPCRVVIDHLGGPDLGRPLEDNAAFQALLRLVRGDDRFFVKVSCPERLSSQAGWDDFVPFGRAMVEAIPDRVLWASDWPHIGVADRFSDTALLAMIPRVAVTPQAQRRMLVDNPAALYWGEDARGP